MSEAPIAQAPDRRIFSVSELVQGLRALLEDRVGRVWVAGEVSNLFVAGSGHQYFTLKDERGQLKAALFRNDARRLPFELEEGMEVLAYAEVTLYEKRGELQVVVRTLEPRGAGALQLAVEQLRRRLEAEGLFALERKRTLPPFPRRVGVVTSAQGAAIRDVIEVSRGRFAATPLLLSPTRVQGEGAEREIAAALERLASAADVDVILLVRGGGSLEDLQAFNSEEVARAIAACGVPVVCGVGHEVDVTIADAAADARAATPSAAAALVLPDRATLAEQLAGSWQRLAAAARTRADTARARMERRGEALKLLAPSARLAVQRTRWSEATRRLLAANQHASARRSLRLSNASRRLEAQMPRLEPRRQRLRAAGRALALGGVRAIAGPRAGLRALVGQLDSLSPLAVLARGYALARRADDGSVVRRADQVARGEGLLVRVAEAEIEAEVRSARPLDPASPGDSPK